MNEVLTASYIEQINKERETNNYLLSTIGIIKDRIAELKKKSNPRSFKFWIRLLFDKQLRNAIRAIIEFDFKYVEATAKDNRGERSELSIGVQEFGTNKDKASTTVD